MTRNSIKNRKKKTILVQNRCKETVKSIERAKDIIYIKSLNCKRLETCEEKTLKENKNSNHGFQRYIVYS